MPQYDGVTIDGCPHELTPGCYLVKVGLKILILEKRYEMGGGLCSEMIITPGMYSQ